MKKIIALSAALMVLLFGFTAATDVVKVENSGVQVCSDLKPDPVPYNKAPNA